MCIVSNIGDWGMQQWPINSGSIHITIAEWNEYQRLKRMAEELDRKLKQPDCVKPEVDEWERKLEDFLKKKGLL